MTIDQMVDELYTTCKAIRDRTDAAVQFELHSKDYAVYCMVIFNETRGVGMYKPWNEYDFHYGGCLAKDNQKTYNRFMERVNKLLKTP